jgi:hypothetical protein
MRDDRGVFDRGAIESRPAAADSHALEPWISPAIIAAAAAAMLWRSWGTWPDPIIDFGRELYIAWRLSAGDVLYRDLAHLNGPFSPYLNALWFKLVGADLQTLVIANTIIWASLLYMLYRILSIIADRLAATISCLGCVGVFSFGQFSPGYGNYNFICPYSHGLTHGVVLSILAIWLLYCSTQSGKQSLRLGAGSAYGCVALTKAEVFLACSVALLPGLVFSVRHFRDRGSARLHLGAFFVGSALPPVMACALLCLAMPIREALWNVLGTWRFVFNSEVAELPLYRSGTGFDDVPFRLKSILGATSFYVVILTPAAIAALRLKRFPGLAARPCTALIATVVTGLMYALLWELPWLHAAKPWPLLQLIVGTVSQLRLVRCGTGADHILAGPAAQDAPQYARVPLWIRSGIAGDDAGRRDSVVLDSELAHASGRAWRRISRIRPRHRSRDGLCPCPAH